MFLCTSFTAIELETANLIPPLGEGNVDLAVNVAAVQEIVIEEEESVPLPLQLNGYTSFPLPIGLNSAVRNKSLLLVVANNSYEVLIFINQCICAFSTPDYSLSVVLRQ